LLKVFTRKTKKQTKILLQMKKLEISQMESFNGGLNSIKSCATLAFLTGLGVGLIETGVGGCLAAGAGIAYASYCM